MPALGSPFSAATSDFKFWLGLLFIVWVYLGAFSIVVTIQHDHQKERTEKDIILYRLPLERWALTRRLALVQIGFIGNYLSKKPSYALISKFVAITKKPKDTDPISSKRSNAVGGKLFTSITQTI
jgi:hypothetical protein